MFLNDQVRNASSELKSLEAKLLELRQKAAPTSKHQGTLQDKEDLAVIGDLNDAHSQLSKSRSRKIQIESEIADANLFLSELNERLASLDESISASTYMGNAIFAFCPSCMTSLTETSTAAQEICHLCKSTISSKSASSQLLRMRNELALQLKESNEIRDDNVRAIESLSRQIPALEEKVRQLADRLSTSRLTWRSDSELAIENTARLIGSKEQEVRHLLEMQKLAEMIDERVHKVKLLEEELEHLRGQLEALRNSQRQRRMSAHHLLTSALRELLHRDLPRQTEFPIADNIEIDFGANRVLVDKQDQFSASSMVYLRHCIHLAFLISSVRESALRFPRIVILDGIEDGGMEPERTANFQRTIKHFSDRFSTDHQIIFSTTQIVSELDSAEFLIGESWSHDHRSIRVS